MCHFFPTMILCLHVAHFSRGAYNKGAANCYIFEQACKICMHRQSGIYEKKGRA